MSRPGRQSITSRVENWFLPFTRYSLPKTRSGYELEINIRYTQQKETMNGSLTLILTKKILYFTGNKRFYKVVF